MRRAPGFTILEMLIALTVSAFAISAALLMAQSQQRSFHGGAKIRQAQASARSALLYLEEKIRLAGYGLDPAEALDFIWYGCTGGPSSCPRDRTDGPDELVFYARHPAYRILGDPPVHHGKAWKATVLDGDTLTLEARAGDVFAKGQILQVACGAEMRYTHVTVAETKKAAGAGPLGIDLDPVAPGLLAAGVTADPFRRQDAARATPPHPDFTKWITCYAISPNVFRIDRYRFYVRPVDMGGGRFDPYLVLDQGIDRDEDGDIDLEDELLIAQGIENLQVAYGFLDPALPVAGRTPGTAITVRNPGSVADTTTETITPTNFPGDYDATEKYPILESSQFFTSSSPPFDVTKRNTNDQGNIRSIQIAIVARSAEPDTAGFSNLKYTPGSRLWVMNFNQLPAWISDYLTSQGGDDRYARALMTTTIQIPNAASRGLVAN